MTSPIARDPAHDGNDRTRCGRLRRDVAREVCNGLAAIREILDAWRAELVDDDAPGGTESATPVG